MFSIVGPSFRKIAPVAVKRNFGTSYALCAKISDPIQQLFLDKIAEFKTKINDKSFLQQYPELQKALDDELMRVTRQYGAEKPEDLAKLPAAKVEQPAVDPQDGF